MAFRSAKHFQTLILGATFLVALSSSALPDSAQTVSVRKEWSELSTTEKNAYRRGVQQMMDWDTSTDPKNYARSWKFWQNIHLHFGDDCAGPVPQIRGMQGQVAVTAKTPDEKLTWCTCEHGTYGFLLWHRMYLYYFEQVIRAASGDEKLTLPYWDYTHSPTIPQEFRDKTYVDDHGATKPNPLYVGDTQRRPVLAAGGRMSPTTVSPAAAFQQTVYFDGNYGFNPALEQVPHGSVHCAIGVAGCPTGIMGSVPIAAGDPIFYLHHAVLDKLYDCWLAPAPTSRLPNDPNWLNKRYNFPDGTGKVVTRVVRDMLTSAQLHVRYSLPEECPSAPRVAALGGRVLAASITKTYPVGGPGRMDTSTAESLTLPPAAERAVRRTPLLAAKLHSELIRIHGIKYDAAPGVSYKVYLTMGSKRVFVQTIDFFTIGSQHKGMPNMGRDIVLDVTDALNTLGAGGAALNSLKVTFEPTTGVDKETKADIAKSTTPNANVRYDGIDLLSRQ